MDTRSYSLLGSLGLSLLLTACQGSTTGFAARDPVTVATLAGSAVDGTGDGQGELAQFHNPVNVAVDSNGSVFVADFSDDDPGRIRKVTATGSVTTVFTQNTFRRPFGLAISGTTLYVTTDRDGTGSGRTSALWQIDTTTNIGTLRLSSINGGRERGIVVRSDGKLVMTDRAQHIVLIVDPAQDPPTVTEWVGSKGTPGFVNGTGNAAQFNQPYGLSVLGSDILVVDSGNHCIRKITPAGVVSTFAGVCQTSGFQNGSALTALFNAPQDLTVDGKGNVYITDNQNHVIRAVSPAGIVTTLAGTGTPGFRDGLASEAQFFAQEGIESDPTGSRLVVADGNGGSEPQPYRRIRLVKGL